MSDQHFALVTLEMSSSVFACLGDGVPLHALQPARDLVTEKDADCACNVREPQLQAGPYFLQMAPTDICPD